MADLHETLPHVTAFPGALGGGILVHTATAVTPAVHAGLASIIEGVESALSRFRPDSLVSQIAHAPYGGRFTFPDWTAAMFECYDGLAHATGGRVDPCIGEDLVRLGYSASFDCIADGTASDAMRAPARSSWTRDIKREGTTLVTHGPVRLDFGACGKGLCVDLLAAALTASLAAAAGDGPAFAIDAGGDITVRGPNPPAAIALEDPHDVRLAIGVAHIADASLCASAPSQRHWRDAAGNRVHHLLNALTGAPADDVAATWVRVPADGAAYPTMLADGLATALFVTDPGRLAAAFPIFDCLVLDEAGHLKTSARFPAELYTAVPERPM